MMTTSKSIPVRSGTFRQFRYAQLKPNPQNPRRLFDREPLQVLLESIRENGILVPLTVYYEKRNNQHYILDGERRWRSAELIETDKKNPRHVPIPANVVDPPTAVANILWMFNIHNLREQWELMPTALSLKILIKELGTDDENKLAELTKLSAAHVRRCKILLSYPKKYQKMMMAPETEKRIRANFFIELRPVLDLYMRLPKSCRANRSRNGLIDHFLDLYGKGKIASVVHFRRILEAYDHLREDGKVDEAKEERFLEAVQTLAGSKNYSIRKLFDPLTAEDRVVESGEKMCRDFLNQLRKLKVQHVIRRAGLRRALQSVHEYVDDLLTKLEG